MPHLPKPIESFTFDDLEQLWGAGLVEDESLDFKLMIPHKEGENRDPWREDRKIKDYGRDQLLATVVAFANSRGGDLVVGVAEVAGSKPGIAERAHPIPDVKDAAHRLSQSAHACIDPPITGLQVRGIEQSSTGEGILIMRVPHSRAGPHRLTTTKECYQRVRDETLAMAMRQIQDLTLNIARGMDRIEKRLGDLRGSFQKWARVDSPPVGFKRMSLRMTCLPTDSAVYLDHVHNVEQVRPRQRNASLKTRPERQNQQLHFPFQPYNWRPVLRGSEVEYSTPDRTSRISVFCDGAIRYEGYFDIAISEDKPEQRGRARTHVLYTGWWFALVVNAIESAVRFREHAGAFAAEYVIETEIVTSHELPILPIAHVYHEASGKMPPGSLVFPRYVITTPESISDVYNAMWRDWWNAMGIDSGGEVFLLDAT